MSTEKARKPRVNFTPEQKLDYAKLMVEEGYNPKQIMKIKGSDSNSTYLRA